MCGDLPPQKKKKAETTLKGWSVWHIQAKQQHAFREEDKKKHKKRRMKVIICFFFFNYFEYGRGRFTLQGVKKKKKLDQIRESSWQKKKRQSSFSFLQLL